MYRLDVLTTIEVGSCRSELCQTGPDMVTLIHLVSPDFTSIFYALNVKDDRVFIQRDQPPGENANCSATRDSSDSGCLPTAAN